jgi:hypothetical protein
VSLNVPDTSRQENCTCGGDFERRKALGNICRLLLKTGCTRRLKIEIPEAVEVNLLVSPLRSEAAAPSILFPPAHKSVAGWGTGRWR